MKNRVIVSERGTVTIPQAIRTVVDIHPGDLLEFEPHKNEVILRHLIVKQREDSFMSDEDWEKFDHLVKKQLSAGKYVSYQDLDKARKHSRKLKR